MRRVSVSSVVMVSTAMLVFAWTVPAQAQPSPARPKGSIFGVAALQRQFKAELPAGAILSDAFKVKLGSPVQIKWDTTKAVFGGLAGLATGLLVAAADCSAGYKSSCSKRRMLLEGGILAGFGAVQNGARGALPGVYPGWLDRLPPIR